MLGVKARLLYTIGIPVSIIIFLYFIIQKEYKGNPYILAHSTTYSSFFIKQLDNLYNQKTIYTAQTCKDLIETIPSIDQAYITRLADHRWHISLEKKIPLGIINKKFILCTDNTIVDKDYFLAAEENNLAHITIPNHAINKINSNLFDIIKIGLHYNEKAKIIITSRYHNDLIMDGYSLRFTYNNPIIKQTLIKESIEQYQAKIKKNNQRIVDIRFKNQIIIYQEPKGEISHA